MQNSFETIFTFIFNIYSASDGFYFGHCDFCIFGHNKYQILSCHCFFFYIYMRVPHMFFPLIVYYFPIDTVYFLMFYFAGIVCTYFHVYWNNKFLDFEYIWLQITALFVYHLPIVCGACHMCINIFLFVSCLEFRWIEWSETIESIKLEWK